MSHRITAGATTIAATFAGAMMAVVTVLLLTAACGGERKTESKTAGAAATAQCDADVIYGAWRFKEGVRVGSDGTETPEEYPTSEGIEPGISISSDNTVHLFTGAFLLGNLSKTDDCNYTILTTAGKALYDDEVWSEDGVWTLRYNPETKLLALREINDNYISYMEKDLEQSMEDVASRVRRLSEQIASLQTPPRAFTVPPRVDLFQYARANQIVAPGEIKFPDVVIPQARIWGWSRNGLVAYSTADMCTATGWGFGFVILNMVNDSIVFHVGGRQDGDNAMLRSDGETVKSLEELVDLLKGYIVSALDAHGIIEQQAQFLPFPLRKDGAVYNVNLEITPATRDENSSDFAFFTRVQSYRVVIDRDVMQSKVIKTVDNARAWGVDVGGYFLSPFENRALVVIIEEVRGFEELVLQYRFSGAHLGTGFRNRDSRIIGRWEGGGGHSNIEMTFGGDGSFEIISHEKQEGREPEWVLTGTDRGTWQTVGTTLTVTLTDGRISTQNDYFDGDNLNYDVGRCCRRVSGWNMKDIVSRDGR